MFIGYCRGGAKERESHNNRPDGGSKRINPATQVNPGCTGRRVAQRNGERLRRGLLQGKTKGNNKQTQQHSCECIGIHGYNHRQGAERGKQETVNDAPFIAPFAHQVFATKGTISKQHEGAKIIRQIKSEINQLALKLVEVEIMFAKWDENTVPRCNKTPEEEYGNQGAQGAVIGWDGGTVSIGRLFSWHSFDFGALK